MYKKAYRSELMCTSTRIKHSTLSYDPDELRGELLSHAGRLGAMMPPALAAASSLPALVTLATTALTSSRREGPHGVDPAIELLTALSHQARAYPAMGPQAAAVRNDPNSPAAAAAAAVRGRLSSALDGAAGESLLRGCIVGLADGLPCRASHASPTSSHRSYTCPRGAAAASTAATAGHFR